MCFFCTGTEALWAGQKYFIERLFSDILSLLSQTFQSLVQGNCFTWLLTDIKLACVCVTASIAWQLLRAGMDGSVTLQQHRGDFWLKTI